MEKYCVINKYIVLSKHNVLIETYCVYQIIMFIASLCLSKHVYNIYCVIKAYLMFIETCLLEHCLIQTLSLLKHYVYRNMFIETLCYQNIVFIETHIMFIETYILFI